jgi:hypothetical protein
MEEELLRTMIEEREARLASIQLKIDAQIKKEEQLKKELIAIRESFPASRQAHETEKKELLKIAKERLEELFVVHQDLAEQGASVGTYAGTVRRADLKDATYVMRMQAQLCKAMHSMGILDHQLEVAKIHAEDIVKAQKDVVTTLTDEKTEIEVRLMNELMKTDASGKGVEDEQKALLDELLKDVEEVERQIEEAEDNSDSDDEPPSEEDEEEKEAKNEMLLMLKEKNDEIEEIEKQIAKKKEQIEEMEMEAAQLQAIGGGWAPSERDIHARAYAEDSFYDDGEEDETEGSGFVSSLHAHQEGGESDEDEDEDVI